MIFTIDLFNLVFIDSPLIKILSINQRTYSLENSFFSLFNQNFDKLLNNEISVSSNNSGKICDIFLHEDAKLDFNGKR